MQPKLLIRQIGRYWNVDRVLKLAFLVCILLTSTSLAFSQKYFYYYNGEKQPLELNTNYVYLVLQSDIPDSNQLSALVDKDVQITKFSLDNSAQTLKAVGNYKASSEYWAELKLKSDMSSEEYLTYLKALEAQESIKIATPYFKNKEEEKIGLSNYFYVKLKSKDDFARLDKMAREIGVAIVGQNKFMPLWYTLKCTKDSKFNALETANRFYESGVFEHAEPDLMVDELPHTPNDPLYGDQWGLNNTGQYGGAGTDMQVEDAWELTKGSRDVIVAVLDQGFEMNHPELQGNTFGTGFDTESGTTPALVLGSHGTACAGIIGARDDNNTGISGVAPNVRLMSVSNSLAGTPNSRQKRADGINWAWQNGADVISNSWGSGVQYAIIDNAITNALNNGRGGLGTIILFSAGNGNGNVSYPANSNPDIIAVGAMSPCGERKSLTSCDGEGWGSDFGAQLDVVAPGVLVSTTDRQGSAGYNNGVAIHPNLGGTLVANDYADQNHTIWFNGTSAACPMVAGVAALVLSVNPCLTHDEVEDIIEQSAQKVGGYAYVNTFGRPNGTWHNEMGYGLVDAEAAVQLAQQMLPDNGDFDIYAKDRPFDIGNEPNPDNGPMWISEDIWVRQNLDGGGAHQNPEFKLFSPNGVYVKIRNKSSVTSDCANLSLYFSKASTGLVWPNHWINYSLSGVLNGDKINTVSIPPIAPGGSYTVEIPWYPPNPGDFVNDIHHFCLLARIESPADPMFSELSGVGVSGNVKKNNNIVWKNVQVYNNDFDGFTSLYVRGTERGWSKIDLSFWDRGFEDKIDKPFFDRGGEIRVKVDPEFFERIKEADLQEVKIIDDNMLYIASPKARISGIPIYSKETFSVHFAFGVDVGEGEEVILDVLQQNTEKRTLEGGERFVITNTRKGQFDKLKLDVKKDNLVYPNPADGEIYLKYEVLSDDSEVEISIYNILDAQQSMKLFSGKIHRGERFEKYDVHKLKKGVYILQLKVGDKVTTERVVIE
ncbi:S8 family serine peptidase [Fulvivirga ulvae]|uniref:S8 family serine peptidase n=1 Tax=Fulvivirga ulvae TaxID=2904245 RepID=UPI001F15BAA2|nr:S8 family serine peptidase [Fulvivirga ulvae]UII31520.1 S8 family serine peptidase [Fulvivirga ulvae]